MVLGRSAGLTEAKLAHLGDDPTPPGVYGDDERAVVDYARASTRLEPIDDALYARLSAHFGSRQLIEVCFVVGLANLVNRFHATFLTDLDEATLRAAGQDCPLPFPQRPGSG